MAGAQASGGRALAHDVNVHATCLSGIENGRRNNVVSAAEDRRRLGLNPRIWCVTGSPEIRNG